MITNPVPVVGEHYATLQGEEFLVIGYGTNGIIVEYLDGSAELMDQHTWESLLADVDGNAMTN